MSASTDVSARRTSPGRRSWVRRWLVRGLLGLVAATVVLGAVGLADAWSAIGTTPKGARLERIAKSTHYRNDKFVDTIPRVEPDVWEASRRWLAGAPFTRPTAPLPILLRSAADFATPPASGVRITWFGHSTLLVEIEGRRVLFDPVWSERCSPSHFVGPKRFHAPPLPLAALPRLDAVAISHDPLRSSRLRDDSGPERAG